MAWKTLKKGYRISAIQHKVPDDMNLNIDALDAFGFGGTVTNVPFPDGFVKNAKNLERFAEMVKVMKERDCDYWIYDENGYPSGIAAYEEVMKNPDLAAKGLYMIKYETYFDEVDFVYHKDGLSDAIVHAVKYKQDLEKNIHDAVVDFDNPIPVEFDKDTAHVVLHPAEICYIFVVKTAHEGSQSVHNTCSRKKIINILSKEAVKAFIDVAYKPVASIKGAMQGAGAIFTDEPGLMAEYTSPRETMNNPLVPYEKTLFDRFKAKYGYDLKDNLPHLFESRTPRAPLVRVHFYELLGEMVAENYVKQIDDFCRENGTILSGHYMGEEWLLKHLVNYGSELKVLMATGYPGMDILQCIPEKAYKFSMKHLQMIARKKNSNGYMTEYCPFYEADEYNKNHFENAMGTLSLLTMYGTRKIASYYTANLCEYDPVRLEGFTGKCDMENFKHLNDYICRICSQLDGETPTHENYVYYVMEDMQARFAPRQSQIYFCDRDLMKADDCYEALGEALLGNGIDYGHADVDDLVAGLSCKRVIIPVCDYIRYETVMALRAMVEKGVQVYFINQKPTMVLGYEDTQMDHSRMAGKRTEKSGVSFNVGEELLDFGEIISAETLKEKIKAEESGLPYESLPERMHVQAYTGGYTVLYNNDRNNAKTVVLAKDATLYNPVNGDEKELKKGDSFTVDTFRAVIIQTK